MYLKRELSSHCRGQERQQERRRIIGQEPILWRLSVVEAMGGDVSEPRVITRSIESEGHRDSACRDIAKTQAETGDF